MQTIMLLLVVFSAIWVAYDAGQRDLAAQQLRPNPTWKWVAGTLLLWIVVFPLYLFKRGAAPLR
jgi:uncharacterized membrane protein YdcZ (DUF606 family)